MILGGRGRNFAIIVSMQDVAANANCRTDTVPTLTYATAQGPAFLWRPWLRLLPLLIAIVATEFAAAVLSHYTIGEIASAALMLLAGAVGFATFLTSFFHRRAAALIAIVMFLVIVPYQGMLGIKWLRLSREADRIINYVQTQKQATSAYPSDLSR